MAATTYPEARDARGPKIAGPSYAWKAPELVWERAGERYEAHAPIRSDSIELPFYATVEFRPETMSWTTIVSIAGTTIHSSEQIDRQDAFWDAQRAVERAVEIRRLAGARVLSA